MRIETQLWDSKNGRFFKETISKEDIENIAKQKILSYYDNVQPENLVDFEILNVNIDT